MKEKNAKKEEWYAGFDIGTNSVGVAVTDQNYNVICKRHVDLWVSRLFDSAMPAISRRKYRTNRRRMDRRQFRIDLLQELFLKEMMKIDNEFFLRLNNSALFEEDKEISGVYTIFNDNNYTDKDYYKQFPTVFHLINYLKSSNKKEDIRLIYIACHYLVKYRGNFLFEGQALNQNVEQELVKTTLDYIAKRLNEVNDYDDFGLFSFENSVDISNKLVDVFISTKGKKKKAEKINELLNPQNIKKIKPICNLLAGKSVKLHDIFLNMEFDEIDAIQFDNSKFNEKESEYMNILLDDYDIIESLKKIYDLCILRGLLQGQTSLSKAMIVVYEKHKKDLKILKEFIRKNFPITTKDGKINNVYYNMFRASDIEGNYCNYVQTNLINGKKKQIEKGKKRLKKASKKEFYDFLKKAIATTDEEILNCAEYKYIMEEIENESFMPKIDVRENSVLPYQLNENELSCILENASNHYDFLLESDNYGTTKEKIISLLTFRVPYYIGPLNDYHNYRDNKDGHAWVIRKEMGKVTPWNFYEKIDDEKSSLHFIRRMTNKCTYLRGKDVLPKNSLLYSEFTLLNEINNLRINGDLITIEIRNRIIDGLFREKKKVSQNALKVFLIKEGIIDRGEELIITGIDDEFKNSLSSYIDFKKIFGDINNDNINMIEDIIFLITIFNNPNKVYKVIKSKYSISEEKLKSIKGLTYKGWGRCSKELLSTLVISEDEAGISHSIISVMKEETKNLNEVLFDRRFNFNTIIENINNNEDPLSSRITYDDVDELYVSPSVKRSIWQSVKIIEEYVKIMGCTPKKIFIETNRSNFSKKKKTKSRKEIIKDFYKECAEYKEEVKELNLLLADISDAKLRSEKIFLYFMQLGKCLYSGRPIDLDSLFSDNFDSDHIIPRCLLKDDSIDNKALVYKAMNQDKEDIYPISPKIQEKMKPLWETLYKYGLMSAEKLARLLRKDELTEEEIADFINRQLVTTNQSVKAVCGLFKRMFKDHDTEIVYSKAENVVEFREIFDIPKCRDINDFHHAKDAYLNIVVGNVFNTKYGHDAKSILSTIRKERISTNTKKIYERTIKGAWEKDKTIVNVKRQLNKNTVQISVMPITRKGEFYNLNLSSNKTKDIFPKKEKTIDLNGDISKYSAVEKYGGYNSISIAYFMIIESEEKKGEKKITIEGIPLIFAKRMEESKDFSENVLKKYLGLINPVVLVNKLLINSIIKYGDALVTICGKTGEQIIVNNYSQLYDNFQQIRLIKDLKKFIVGVSDKIYNYKGEDDFVIYTNKLNGEVRKIGKEKMIDFYDYLLKKLYNPKYSSLSGYVNLRNGLIEKKEEFINKDLVAEAEIIIQLLKVFKFDSQTSDLEKLGLAKKSGKLLIAKKITDKHISIISSSITGFYKKTIWENKNVI